eukprot:2679640-Pleurochrysis_carterae.AAC.3
MLRACVCCFELLAKMRDTRVQQWPHLQDGGARPAIGRGDPALAVPGTQQREADLAGAHKC